MNKPAFEIQRHVEFYETDMAGIVHFSNFFRYMETCEHAFVRSLDHELHGMLDGLDPYSRYYDAESSEQARREIDGDFRGIGVVFRSPISRGQVLFPLAGSPASRAGVRVGDRFVEVDGTAVEGLTGPEVRGLLSARGRSEIGLLVEGLDGGLRDLVIEPAMLLDPTVRHAGILSNAPATGYLAGLAAYMLVRRITLWRHRGYAARAALQVLGEVQGLRLVLLVEEEERLLEAPGRPTQEPLRPTVKSLEVRGVEPVPYEADERLRGRESHVSAVAAPRRVGDDRGHRQGVQQPEERLRGARAAKAVACWRVFS